MIAVWERSFRMVFEGWFGRMMVRSNDRWGSIPAIGGGRWRPVHPGGTPAGRRQRIPSPYETSGGVVRSGACLGSVRLGVACPPRRVIRWAAPGSTGQTVPPASADGLADRQAPPRTAKPAIPAEQRQARPISQPGRSGTQRHSLKGGDPAAGSPTATLLRLHPSR